MLNTIKDFCVRINEIDQLDQIDNAYFVFEDDCTEQLRDQIYNLVDDSSSEPFRDAMYHLGFINY